MSAISRGTKNAFRNPLRTISVVAILGISLALVMIMLAANNAVNNRISELKKSIGNTISVSPAGFRGLLGGGEPLGQPEIKELSKIDHVTGLNITLEDQLVTDTNTSLKSSIEAGTLGQRAGQRFQGAIKIEGGTSQNFRPNSDSVVNFTPPIFAIGTNNAEFGGSSIGNTITITNGAAFDAAGNDDVALLGKNVAEKNNLTTGQTFTAYDKTITVSGIYDAGNDFSNNSVLFPLATLQRLSNQTEQVTATNINVDSADNLAAVTTAIKEKLGDKADVVSSADTINATIQPLANIRSIATTSLFGALIAATVIILLTMVIIVRERRKEIAVLKAIGGSDLTIMTQFITESVMLSWVGSVFGIIGGLIFSKPIINALAASGDNPGRMTVAVGGPTVARVAMGGVRAVQGAFRDLQATVGWEVILWGLGAALLVAIIGSAFPAWLISKIRPAEILRSE